ncbi:MAG: glycosyltransferase family 4 protein [Flavobacteriales bacterium]|nr:glycosyltransferase family 4 protein [Flavobacteriales bacterium]
MKIALLTDGIYPFVLGGMQRHSGNVLKQMLERGHEVTLVHCVPWNAKEMPDRNTVMEKIGLSNGAHFEAIVLRFPKPGILPGHYLKESYQYARKIYDVLKSQISGFDFIYAKGFCAWHILHEKSRGAQMPPVGVKFHGYEMFQKDANLKAKLQSLMLRGPVRWNNTQADVVFSYGGHITEIIKGLGVTEGHIAEVSGGIDPEWISLNDRKATQGIRKFLFIGRNERRKGIEELHSVLSKWEDTDPIEFHFIGPISQSVRLKKSYVNYHGSISDSAKIREIMDKCDVLVVPSFSEGMPNVILEGMARGMAVIASDVGAVNIEVDENTGWLIQPGDENALRKAILIAAQCSPRDLLLKQSAARRKVKELFLWPSVVKRLETAIFRYTEAQDQVS